LIGVNITTGDTQRRLTGANWSEYTDRLLTCTISG